MKFIKSFLTISTLIFLSACSTSSKIAALKPAPDYNTGEIIYDKQVSFVNMPVELSVADIQNQTNKYLNGLIYEDNSMEGDNMMLKVWKQAPIVVGEQGGKIQMQLPLKIWTRVKYGIGGFGLSAYDTREINLNGVVRLSTTAGLTNWKLITNTQIDGIDWKESPSVSVLGKNVPITYLINPALTVFKGRLGKLIDDAIAQSVDFKPYVLTALDQLSKPIEVNTDYQTWFALQPIELYASKATVANKKITMSMGMKAYMETSVGTKPTLSFDKNKLVLKAVDNMPNEFNTNIAGITTYQNAANLMQKNFAGQKFESGSRSVTVNKVDLWGKNGKIIVALNVSGSVNGDIYLAGTPLYDAAKKEIYLDQIDFVLDSKNKLLKTGEWLAHGIIVKKIEQNCRFSIADQLNTGQKSLVSYLTNYEPVKGVKVNGALTELAPNKIFLTPNAIVAMVAAKGKVAVTIDGLQ